MVHIYANLLDQPKARAGADWTQAIGSLQRPYRIKAWKLGRGGCRPKTMSYWLHWPGRYFVDFRKTDLAQKSSMRMSF